MVQSVIKNPTRPTKHVSWRDEQGVSLTGTSELSDPAILAVNLKFRYDKEQLLKIREAPLSQRKPDFFDITEVSSNIWDHQRWNSDKKKSDSTIGENGTRNPEEHRRRTGDPRERIRKENDGIVLSPQRRSFNSGCAVQARNPRGPASNIVLINCERPHSPLGAINTNKTDTSTNNTREIPTNNRRIGSGRIIRDSWDEKNNDSGNNDNNSNEYSGFRGGVERRGFREERRSGGRFSGDRRRNGGDSRDEEPEWFSGGPSSQNDTIELRGFDESDRLTTSGKKKMSPSQAKRARDWFKKKTEIATVTEEKDEVVIEEGPDGRSTPTPQAGEGSSEFDDKKKETEKGKDEVKSVEADAVKNGGEKNLNDQAFIFEDILKSDSIPGLPALLTNGVGGEGDTTGTSRFSKWFGNSTETRKSSGQEDNIMKNLLKDLSEPSVSIPGDSNSYFAPISPAANTGNVTHVKGISIMDMLQRGQKGENLKQQVSGRIMNLNEIEAKLRQNVEPHHHSKHHTKNDEDMTAFNRLLANMGANATNKSQQPMSLMEMLSHSQQMDEAQARMSNLLGPTSPSGNPHDIAARLQQKQQVEMLTKLMNAGVPVRASPLPEMGLQQSRELLSRPEAQAILQAIHQRIPSPRELQVHTQNILQRALIKKKLEEQQENYRKKQEMQQRGQSPNNNNNNTTNSNNNNQQPTKSVSSPTPLAFTPTSVLRKMTAEKDEGGKDVTKLVESAKLGAQSRATAGVLRPTQQQQSQWPPYQMKQAGRPIVKANNFQQQQQQQQQEFFNQQQQQKFLSQLQQQRKAYSSMPVHTAQYTTPNSSQQFSQQLRAQHQQHARPVQQQQQPFGGGTQQPQASGGTWQFLNSQQTRGQVGRGGATDGELSPTSNQLTRWFSPDLLERARVGELPSTAGLSQHLLSLEDIERLTAPPVHN